ncbi:hypothetical protein [Kocuria sp. PD6]|uniref:hypothetical protein n=1 Tax=Kocuria sp. PD6 TaxID=2962590 RepID=UPI002882706F|nr:hypothetical protein [Kocuria sp. PD6]MDT0120666.1 hypothetical protein [Kocuria sp. PD6]
MGPIATHITGATRLALDTREIHETTTKEGARHLEATIRLRPNLDMGELGTPHDMTLAITEEDAWLDVQVTYSSENGVEMMHEHFYGVHPADLDTRLESLSHAPRFN